MKIAISTDQGYVSAHFGRCPSYTVFEINDGIIQSKEEIPNPGHQPGFLPQFLAERGVNAIIAGGMGPRAQALFSQKNIDFIIGVQGSIDEVIQKYLNHELVAGEDLCGRGHEGTGQENHECQHDSPHQPVQSAPQPSGRRICVTSLGSELDSEVDPKFGRAHFFLIFDPETEAFESIENPNRELGHGAGIQTAQLIAGQNVGVVLSGAFGPKAAQVLQTAGIRMETGFTGSVKNALAKFRLEG
jgi:predicted Fe-Mo cluster-binding NifX family protein